MGDVSQWAAINAVLLVFVPIAFGLFGPEGERGFAAWMGFCLVLWATFIAWPVFVAVHFISKYW